MYVYCVMSGSKLQTTSCAQRMFNIRIEALRVSNIQHSTDGRSNVENPTSEEECFGCRISNIRRTADRMSKIRHPKKSASDVEYSTFDYAADRIEKIRSKEGCFGCRIFDIRLCGRSNRKNPIRQIKRIESNLRHSIRQNPHV